MIRYKESHTSNSDDNPPKTIILGNNIYKSAVRLERLGVKGVCTGLGDIVKVRLGGFCMWDMVGAGVG